MTPIFPKVLFEKSLLEKFVDKPLAPCKPNLFYPGPSAKEVFTFPKLELVLVAGLWPNLLPNWGILNSGIVNLFEKLPNYWFWAPNVYPGYYLPDVGVFAIGALKADGLVW